MVRGDRKVIAKTKELIGKAKTELLLNFGWVETSTIRQILPALRDANSRGVEVKIICSPKEKQVRREVASLLTRVAKLKFAEVFLMNAVIVDHEEVLLVILAGLSETGYPKEKAGFWVLDPGLAEMGRSYFEFFWELSE